MRKVVLTALMAGLPLAVIVGAQSLGPAKGKSMIKADTLSGYQEVAGAAPRALVERARASSTRSARRGQPGRSPDTLTYTGLVAPATVAHIHFGNRSTSRAASSVFFCGGGHG